MGGVSTVSSGSGSTHRRTRRVPGGRQRAERFEARGLPEEQEATGRMDGRAELEREDVRHIG